MGLDYQFGLRDRFITPIGSVSQKPQCHTESRCLKFTEHDGRGVCSVVPGLVIGFLVIYNRLLPELSVIMSSNSLTRGRIVVEINNLK